MWAFQFSRNVTTAMTKTKLHPPIDSKIVKEACALMGISQRSLYRLLKKHGVSMRRIYVASLPAMHAPLDTNPTPEETPNAPV